MMATGWPDGGEKVATYPRTHVRTRRTNVPLLRSGAAAPLGANEVVAAYVRGRSEAGLVTDTRLRGMCGRYARQLLAAHSWDREVLLEAVERFGATKRSPRFLSEWASQIVVEREDKARVKSVAIERDVATPDCSLHRLDVAAVLAQMRAG